MSTTDRMNSTPAPAGDLQIAVDGPTRVEAAKAKFSTGVAKSVTYVKAHPKTFGAAAIAVIVLGYFGFSGSSKYVPAAQANLPPAQASKVRETGEVREVEMVVQSYRKTDKLLILNNHANYQQASMTVVVDLTACPELSSINPRALRGQTVQAKGQFQTYDGKPQIKITKAGDLKIDPKAVTIPAAKS